MHKLPTFVFKILGLSLILMFLLDSTIVVIDTLTVHSRVTNLAGIMQNEIARNNCMPTALAGEFNNQLSEIASKSNVASDIFETNLFSSKYKSEKEYRGLQEENALDYGETADLFIEFTMNPTVVYLNNNPNNENGLLGRGRFSYTMTYTYSVPCLRYLK